MGDNAEFNNLTALVVLSLSLMPPLPFVILLSYSCQANTLVGSANFQFELQS